MCDSGDLALNSVISIPTPPAADKYIYMVTGAATKTLIYSWKNTY